MQLWLFCEITGIRVQSVKSIMKLHGGFSKTERYFLLLEKSIFKMVLYNLLSSRNNASPSSY